MAAVLVVVGAAVAEDSVAAVVDMEGEAAVPVVVSRVVGRDLPWEVPPP